MADRLLELTAAITTAWLANNRATPEEVDPLIRAVHHSLRTAGAPEPQELGETARRPTPAQIRRSVTPDAIISFEDGRPYRSMKRSLALRGLTPDQYREKWGLPHDYPMVAPNYSAQRSALARQLGLGRRAGAKAPAGGRGRGCAKPPA